MCNFNDNRNGRGWFSLALLVTTLFGGLVFAPLASADDGVTAPGEGATPHAHRPLTLPGGTLRIDIDQRALGFTSADDVKSPFWSLSLGLAYGFGDDLEIGLSTHRMGPTLPSHSIYPAGAPALMLAPYGELGNIPLYIRSRLADTDAVEVVLDAGLLFPVQSDFSFDFGVLLRLSLHPSFTLDLGAQYLFVLQGSEGDDCPSQSACQDGSTLALWLPLEATFQLGPRVFVALETGIELDHYDIERSAIPLGGRLGATFGNESEAVELGVAFSMPRFLRPAGGDAELTTELWQVTVLLSSFIGT